MQINNSNKQSITLSLEEIGFISKTEDSWGHQRMTHSKVGVGSIYVGDSYISGTGSYKKIKNKVRPSSYDWRGYPEWKANQVLRLLEYLESNFF